MWMSTPLTLARATACLVVVVCAGAALAFAAAANAAGHDRLLAPEYVCPNPGLSASPRVQMKAMLCYHDYARRQMSEPVLRSITPLQRSAALKGRWVRVCHQFTHVPCGRPFRSAFSEVGYTRGAWMIGENLGWGAGSLGRVREMFAAWLRSPPHREDIINPNWREIGLARIHAVRLFGADEVTLWVAHFGVH
jgi:hypothetical protein